MRLYHGENGLTTLNRLPTTTRTPTRSKINLLHFFLIARNTRDRNLGLRDACCCFFFFLFAPPFFEPAFVGAGEWLRARARAALVLRERLRTRAVFCLPCLWMA